MIAFEVAYTIAGRIYIDDNSAQSYLAPRPGTDEAAMQGKRAAAAKATQ